MEIIAGYSPPAVVSFPAGTYTGYHLDGSRKGGTLAHSSTAHTSAKVGIEKGLLASGINGTFVYIVDGIWAGYYVAAAGLTVTQVAPVVGHTDAEIAAARAGGIRDAAAAAVATK